MTLSINTNLEYDEALGFNSTDVDNDTDSNVASLTADLTSAISTVYSGGSGWTYYSAPTGFPQYAEMSNFVTSDQAVTSYFLAKDTSGDGFATSGLGVATGLYVGAVNAGDEIYLYGTSDPNVVIGRIGGDTGAVALVIALHGDPANPELGVAVYAPITDPKAGSVDDADSLNLDGLIYLGSHFTTTEEHDFDSFAGVPSGSDAFAMILPDTVNDLQLLVTGFTGSTEQPITISQDANAGSIGGGGGGQHVGSGNSLRIDFISGGDFSKADSSSEDNNFANISYTQHQEADKASFELVQINPGTAGTTTSLNIFAYDNVGNYQGANFPTNAISSEGTAVTIDPSNVHVLDAQGHAATGVTISAVTGGGVHITGLQLDYTVVFSTPGAQFDRFTITNTQPAKGSGSNVTFDVGHIHVTTVTNGSGTEFTNIGDNMIFEDGGPSFGANGTAIPNVQVDETTLGSAGKTTVDFHTLFDPHYGADGPASSSPLAYALGLASTTGVDSGLVDTASGHEIYLFKDGNDVVGRVGNASTPNSSGQIDFRISVDSDGKVTFEQDYAVIHPDATATDEPVHMSAGTAAATAALVTLTATATDGDGDSASSSALGIGGAFTILDDEPHSLGTGSNVTVGNTTSATDPDGAGPALAGGASGSFSNTVNAGNDGVGSFIIKSYNPGTGTVGGADTSGDYTWAYGANQSTITESYKGTPLFTLTLNSSGGVYDGTYTVAMLSTLPFSSLNLDANNIKAGGPTGSIDVGTLNDGGDYVEISGLTNTTFNSGAGTLTGTTGAVNASNGNVGVNNGNLDSGEVLEFQLFAPGGGSPIGFYGLDMGTKTASSSSYELYGLFHSDGKIHDLGPSGTLLKGGVIHYAGPDLLDAIYVKETTGNAVKIGLAGVHLLLPPADSGFHFAAQLTDGDGDSVFSPFNVFIDGNNDGAVDTGTVAFPS